MLTPQDRQRSKSARRIKIKSPLNLVHKNSLQEKQLEKMYLKKSKASSSETIDSDRKIMDKNRSNFDLNFNPETNWKSSAEFKNKIIISSAEFNRLKQKLQSAPRQSQKHELRETKRSRSKNLKIKILDGLSKQTSQNSEKTQTNNKSTGSSDSEQIEMLKIENQCFRKIYDDALSELSKLQNKLKEQKKVHEAQRQIYENEIKKLKRIIDCDNEEVSHIICDEENRYIIVVSTIDRSQDENDFLGIHSDCEEEVSSLSVVSRH